MTTDQTNAASLKAALNPATAPTCTKPLKIQPPCPCCGENIANVSVQLWDLDGESAIHCHECDAEFSLDSIRELVGKWSVLLHWLDSAPTI